MTDYPDSDYEDTPEELNEERITNLVAENDRLRAEVERYFKAGQEAEAEVERLRGALSELADVVALLEGVEIPYPIAIPLGVKLQLACAALRGER